MLIVFIHEHSLTDIPWILFMDAHIALYTFLSAQKGGRQFSPLARDELKVHRSYKLSTIFVYPMEDEEKTIAKQD